MKLVLSERKSVNTLTYIALVAMAYFGPNAQLMGNIQLSIWQFQRPITDIEAYLFKVSLLMVVDIFSLLLNGVLLWHFCKINVMKVMKKLQGDFWFPFGITEAFIVLAVMTFENCSIDYVCKKIFFRALCSYALEEAMTSHWNSIG